MFPIKSFLKIKQPEGMVIVPEQKLEFVYQFMYNHDPACEYLFDKEIAENPKQDINDLMADIIDRMIKKHERTRDCLLSANYKWMKYLQTHPNIGQAINKSIKSDKPQLFFITFTTNETSSEEAMVKYVEKHLGKYKYVYSLEKESADSKRPHIHAVVEGDYFHTKKNLRPTKQYNANINIKKITTDNGILNYITKEGNTPKGDLEYIKNQLSKI